MVTAVGSTACDSPPGVQVDQTVGQTGDEVVVVVAGSEDQVAVDREHPERVQEGHLLRDSFVRPAELV